MSESRGVAHQDGCHIPFKGAGIHIMEPAFTKDAAAFDVVTVRDDAFFRFKDHPERFRAS